MMKKKALIVLSDGESYKKEIFSFFEDLTIFDYDILHVDRIATTHNYLHWVKLGRLFRNDEIFAENINDYSFIILPFLDIGTLAKIVQCINDTIDTKVIQNALRNNVPCFGFDYHCNPQSQLHDFALNHHNSYYDSLISNNINAAEKMGLKFIKPKALLNFDRNQTIIGKVEHLHKKYITLADVIDHDIYDLNLIQDHKFTDLALECLKKRIDKQKGQ